MQFARCTLTSKFWLRSRDVHQVHRVHSRSLLWCSDHGAPGILGMPSGEFLYADKLTKTLHKKAQDK